VKKSSTTKACTTCAAKQVFISENKQAPWDRLDQCRVRAVWCLVAVWCLIIRIATGVVVKKNDRKKTPGFFLKKAIKPTKKNIFYFFFEKIY